MKWLIMLLAFGTAICGSYLLCISVVVTVVNKGSVALASAKITEGGLEHQLGRFESGGQAWTIFLNRDDNEVRFSAEQEGRTVAFDLGYFAAGSGGNTRLQVTAGGVTRV